MGSNDTARLMALTPAEMPPHTDDLGTLLDLVQQRHGFDTRAEVWRMVGVDPKDGRAFLTRNAGRVTWPLWFTLRHAAFGDSDAEREVHLLRGLLGQHCAKTVDAADYVRMAEENERLRDAAIRKGDQP